MALEGADRAKLFLRSAAIGSIDDIQERMYERLERLATDDIIDSVECEIWGRDIPADPDAKTPVRETYDEFVKWADEHECSLAPAFSIRKVGTMVSEETRNVISMPMVCLAVYEGDEVQAVFPCLDDDEVYTVQDGLAELEAANGIDGFSERNSPLAATEVW